MNNVEILLTGILLVLLLGADAVREMIFIMAVAAVAIAVGGGIGLALYTWLGLGWLIGIVLVGGYGSLFIYKFFVSTEYVAPQALRPGRTASEGMSDSTRKAYLKRYHANLLLDSNERRHCTRSRSPTAARSGGNCWPSARVQRQSFATSRRPTCIPTNAETNGPAPRRGRFHALPLHDLGEGARHASTGSTAAASLTGRSRRLDRALSRNTGFR
jgi:hypothetical protein